jgi:GNAT superfamily N-acetyltransferase
MTEVRPFARRDREQLTRLASAHVAAAMPGASLPAAVLLSQLEQPVGESVIGPWVRELQTLVAVEGDRLIAAAHLRRYLDDEQVSADYRNAGEVVWLLCWPEDLPAGRAVLEAAIEQLRRWNCTRWHGDGSLPAPGVYGVSDAWPHVLDLYQEAGFDPHLQDPSASAGQIETVFAGELTGIDPPGPAPIAAVTLRRQLGPLGTAFNAVLDGEIVGTFEVDDDLSRGGTNAAYAGWADECNHWVRDGLRGRGIGTWLVANAAAWLRLGGKTRLMAYVVEDAGIERATAYYARYRMQAVNRTTRGWTRSPA